MFKLHFVTGNVNKFLEAKSYYNNLEHVRLDCPELQFNCTEKVVVEKAKYALNKVNFPFVVEDVGLKIEQFGGFPGPFVKFWVEMGGVENICNAVKGNCNAEFVCSAAVVINGKIDIFSSSVKGLIAEAPSIGNGFGFDSVFIPNDSDLTLAQDKRFSPRKSLWDQIKKHIGSI